MRVLFTSPFDYVTLRSKSGTPRALVAYQPGKFTVPREHGEAAVKAGAGVEVDAPKADDAKDAGVHGKIVNQIRAKK